MRNYPAFMIVFILFLSFTSVQAQHNNELYNNGATIFISAGDSFSVHGDVHLNGGTFTNNGLMEVQGNLYSDATFQQRGLGTVRLENNDVNIADTQFVSGSFVVRGGQSQIGVNDGSFYNLELANTQGIVYLLGTGNVADVRNQVDFAPVSASGSPPVNRIITHNLGLGLPTNGSAYEAVFGIMNPTPGFSSMLNNTVVVNGNSSNTDNGYVQGRLRRAVAVAGGQYPFVLGLEPAGAGAQRGIQYIRLDFGVNNYDVIEGYFETASPNFIGGSPIECGYNVSYFGGVDHGEWVFDDITSMGAGAYTVWVWPQDDNFSAQSTWFITKDNSIQGTLGQCGPSPVGLSRSAFNGFSEFGVAAGTVIFPVTLTSLEARPVANRFIRVDWTTIKEENMDHFEVERSIDNALFGYIGQQAAGGNTSSLRHYTLDDKDVLPGIDYFYRLKMVDKDGATEYSNSVLARLLPTATQMEVKLYPNPLSGDDLQLDIYMLKEKLAKLYVVDGRGKIVRSIKLELKAGANHFQIATESLAVGPYLLRLEGGEFSLVRKFVKIDSW